MTRKYQIGRELMKNNKKIFRINKLLVLGFVFVFIISSMAYLSKPYFFKDSATDYPMTCPVLDVVKKDDSAEVMIANIISHNTGTRDRTGNTNLNVSVIGSFSPAYLGDLDLEFYFFVTESYNGEYYDLVDPIPGGDFHNTSLWNVSLDKMAFYFDNQPVTPVDWDSDRQLPDNNSGFGWRIAGSGNFYNDSATMQRFRFNVKASDILTGTYELRLTFKYRLIKNYTAVTNKYNYTFGNLYITEIETINFEVRSCLTSNLNANALDEDDNIINNGRFYAGATNQKLSMVFDKNYPGATLENVKVSLVLPPFLEIFEGTGIDNMNIVSVNTLSASTSFYWRVTLNNSVLPRSYSGTDEFGYVQYEYIRGDNLIQVVEINKYPVNFIIDYTPLITPPPTNGMMDDVPAEHQIVQGTSKTILTINFTNQGNVDLFDVDLGLDLSNSFIKAPYYYDAGASDMKNELILSNNSIGSLPIGSSAFASFDLSVYQGLPKGKYLIPVVYTGWYYNNGTLGDPSGIVKTNDNDFINIRGTYNLPFLDKLPHLAVEILNPKPHITVNSANIDVYTAGLQNQVIALTLSNYELYDFQNVTVSVLTSAASPFEHKSMNYTSPYLWNKTFDTLPSGIVGIPYTTTFSILANIKSDANGYYSVPVMITGWDIYNDYFEMDTIFEVSIIPQLPQFVVVNSINSEVIPGENFTLEVTIKNVGGSVANNLEVLFIGSSGYTNTFIPSGDGIITIGNLAAGEQVTIKFNASADNNLTIGNNYLVHLKFKFTDILGTVYGFNDNEPVSFNIRTKLREELPSISEVFLITAVNAPDVNPGSTIRLTVTVMNIGDFEIFDSNVTLVTNSNLFKITLIDDSEFGKGTLGVLKPLAQKNVRFDIVVSKSAERGEMYKFKLFIQYQDSSGQMKHYDTSEWLAVSLRVKEVPPPEEEEEDTNWELITVGILIFIAAIIFILWLGMVIKKLSREPPAAEKERFGIEEEEPEPEEKAEEEELEGEPPKEELEEAEEEAEAPGPAPTPSPTPEPEPVPTPKPEPTPTPAPPARSAVKTVSPATAKPATPVKDDEISEDD